MHYIRLLSRPTVQDTQGRRHLKLVLSITTDLYDAYLSPKKPVELCVFGRPSLIESKPKASDPFVDLTKGAHPKWTAGMRVLKLNLSLPPGMHIQEFSVRPVDEDLTLYDVGELFDGQRGLILPVYAGFPGARSECAPTGEHEIVYRSMSLSEDGSPFGIEEDLGESMARHIWDGGLAALSLFINYASLQDNGQFKKMSYIAELVRLCHPMNMVELGCGVGTLGIGIAQFLSEMDESYKGSQHRVLLTDLPDAAARANANIARYRSRGAKGGDPERDTGVKFEALDWANGRRGAFGPELSRQAWDLVLVSDCTYNADTLPALVETLDAIHAHSARLKEGWGAPDRGTMVFLATKPRHESEGVVFKMLEMNGWEILEMDTQALPHLDQVPQAFEAYLLTKDPESDDEVLAGEEDEDEDEDEDQDEDEDMDDHNKDDKDDGDNVDDVDDENDTEHKPVGSGSYC
ncbi:hypothetical protein P8C59_008969 [Phyllachora maydis]|uniref:Uncharacterized protein n=1 Tax=Phyllachora maydis TaxID=1825666 RepID=A0AAD9IC56_9PEZI|nr:hypothetical protein P8C59_008969 [Phyllachora maydis]